MHNPDTARFVVRELRVQIRKAVHLPQIKAWSDPNKVVVMPRNTVVRGWGG